eukprot:6857079-Pyramimonas_sp.AAC.1
MWRAPGDPAKAPGDPGDPARNPTGEPVGDLCEQIPQQPPAPDRCSERISASRASKKTVSLTYAL